MKLVTGFSGKKIASIIFLLAVLLISLILGSVSFLINDNPSSLPNIGIEGNENMDEEVSEKDTEEDTEEIYEKDNTE